MRRFFAVGNGLFAIESNYGLTSVYDCGSTSQSTIDLAIDRALNIHRGAIDNVFISHYDKDHVNGILKLLTVYPIKRVILPMIPELARVINSSTVKDSFQYYFILSPERVIQEISPQTDVIHIGNRDFEEDNQQLHERVELQNLGNSTVLHSNFQILGINNWLYVIYNKRILTCTELTLFYKYLGLATNATSDEIISALRRMSKATDLKKDIGTIFSKTELSKINDYSMVVWSGRKEIREGCLYTGDYNAKKYIADIHKVYANFLRGTEIIQIPHHGSYPYFHPNICHPHSEHIVSAHHGPYSRQKVDPIQTINTILRLGYKCQDTRYGDVML